MSWLSDNNLTPSYPRNVMIWFYVALQYKLRFVVSKRWAHHNADENLHEPYCRLWYSHGNIGLVTELRKSHARGYKTTQMWPVLQLAGPHTLPPQRWLWMAQTVDWETTCCLLGSLWFISICHLTVIRLLIPMLTLGNNCWTSAMSCQPTV